MRLWPLLVKEARIVGRSRLLLVVLLLYPLVIVSIIGFAFSQPNQRVPVAVVNQDVDAQGRPNVGRVQDPVEGNDRGIPKSSQDIIAQLGAFADVRQVATEPEGLDLLLQGEVQAVVIFPPNFIQDIVRYDSSGRLKITLDQSDPIRAKFMETLIRGIVQEFQEEIIEEKVRLVVAAIDTSNDPTTAFDPDDPLYPGFPGVRARVLEIRDNHPDLTPEQKQRLNETVAFLDKIIDTLQNSKGILESVAQPVNVTLAQEESGSLFIRDLIVPAALGLSIFWTGTLATSSLVVYEREAAAFTRLRITPTSRVTIYTSKILLAGGIILLQSLAILGAAILFWQTRIDNLLLTFVLIVLSSFASIGLGLFVAGLSREVNGSVLLSVLVTFPMLFLAGLFYPVTFMPKGAQVLAGLFPLTYTVAGLRGSMLRGFGFSDALGPLVALAIFAMGLTVLGVLLGRRLERKA